MFLFLKISVVWIDANVVIVKKYVVDDSFFSTCNWTALLTFMRSGNIGVYFHLLRVTLFCSALIQET